MYGLSSDQDLTFIVDRELVQVCVGRHDVILNLDGASIAIQTDVTFCESPSKEVHYEEITQMIPRLLDLLSAKILRASAVPPGTLQLEWSSGVTLKVHDSSKEYESYQIRGGDRLIVV